MARIRTFVAIDLTDEVRRRLRSLLHELQGRTSSVRWVESSQMHVTLKFLGEVDDSRIYDVCQSVQRVASNHEGLAVACRALGAFPSERRPRTVWAGLDDREGRIVRLQGELEEDLRRLGFAQEHRPFRPHVTLGRVLEGRQGDSGVSEILAMGAQVDAGLLEIDQLTVYGSQLSRSGPQYTVLSRSKLRGGTLRSQ